MRMVCVPRCPGYRSIPTKLRPSTESSMSGRQASGLPAGDFRSHSSFSRQWRKSSPVQPTLNDVRNGLDEVGPKALKEETCFALPNGSMDKTEP